jgi:hypothetical protein
MATSNAAVQQQEQRQEEVYQRPKPARNADESFVSFMYFYLVCKPDSIPDETTLRKALQAMKASLGYWPLAPDVPAPDTFSVLASARPSALLATGETTGAAPADKAGVASASVAPAAASVTHINPKTRSAQKELPNTEQERNTREEPESEEAQAYRDMFIKGKDFDGFVRKLIRPSHYAVWRALWKYYNPKNKGWVWPWFSTLGAEANCSRRTAIYAVEEMIKLGLITDKESGKQEGLANGYELCIPSEEGTAYLKQLLEQRGCAKCRAAERKTGLRPHICKICIPQSEDCTPGMQKKHTKNMFKRTHDKQHVFDSNQATAQEQPVKAKTTEPSEPKSSSIGQKPNSDQKQGQGREQKSVSYQDRRHEQVQRNTNTPDYLLNLAESFSRDMNDLDHVKSNRSQVANIYHDAGVPVKEFAEMMHTAKARTSTAAIRMTGHNNHSNRMPYFFKALRSLALGEEIPEGRS